MAEKGTQINITFKIILGVGAIAALSYFVSKDSGSGQASVPVTHIENNVNTTQENNQSQQNGETNSPGGRAGATKVN